MQRLVWKSNFARKWSMEQVCDTSLVGFDPTLAQNFGLQRWSPWPQHRPESRSFSLARLFRSWASRQQQQILLILTKLQSMKGNGRYQFSWWRPWWFVLKSASPKALQHLTSTSLHLKQCTHDISISLFHLWGWGRGLKRQQPLLSSGTCEISHLCVFPPPTTHLLICAAPLFSPPRPIPLLFLSPSRIWNPSIVNNKRCGQSSPSDGSYNFLWTIRPP